MSKSKKEDKKERPVIKRVLIPLKLDSTQEVNTIGVRGVDGFLVTISGPGGMRSRQITVHKALGQVPPEVSGKWVATPTAELHYLMENREAPGATAIINRRKEFILNELATEGNVLVYANDKTTICYPNGVNRNLALSVAQKEYNKAIAAAKKDKELSKPQSRLEFLTKELFEAEQDVSEHSKDPKLHEKAKEMFPLPKFETCGGPLADRMQVPIGYLGEELAEAMSNFEALVLSMQEEDPGEDEDPTPELLESRKRAKQRRRAKGVTVPRKHRSRSRVPFRKKKQTRALSPSTTITSGEGASMEGDK